MPGGVTPVCWSGVSESLAAREGGQEGSTHANEKEAAHTPEQILRKPTVADRLVAGGADGGEVALQLGVAEQTYYRWRNQFDGLKSQDAKRVKELEREQSHPWLERRERRRHFRPPISFSSTERLLPWV